MQELGTGDSREKPIKLGGALVTIVEPHRGHEVAYNRWYERDHFYAGCMIGAWTIAGGRFVATRECKARRYPTDSPVCPDPTSGSYLSVYWILAGRFGDWIRWGTDQVNWLHDNDRMFPHRDHVHTLMYRMRAEYQPTDDGIPAELAFDHHFPGLALVIGEPAEGRTVDDVDAWLGSHRDLGNVTTLMAPVPLLGDAPSDVPRDTHGERFVALAFCDEPILAVWDERFARLGDALAADGVGRVLFASPFLATVPGTDAYTDELW